jgi:hypothetical protein
MENIFIQQKNHLLINKNISRCLTYKMKILDL